MIIDGSHTFLAPKGSNMHWFAIAAALTGAAHIYTDYRGPRAATYLFKPATMLLIIGMLWSFPAIDNSYRLWLTAGLLASLVGDCFLMLPSKPLLPGLGSFLIAHVFYVYAFFSRADVQWNFWLSLIGIFLLLWMAGLFYFMKDKLGKLMVAGPVYILALGGMVLFAANNAIQNVAGGDLLLLGALFFLVSDSSLAFNRLYQPYRAAQLLILSSYYVAQYLIAASAIGLA